MVVYNLCFMASKVEWNGSLVALSHAELIRPLLPARKSYRFSFLQTPPRFNLTHKDEVSAESHSNGVHLRLCCSHFKRSVTSLLDRLSFRPTVEALRSKPTQPLHLANESDLQHVRPERHRRTHLSTHRLDPQILRPPQQPLRPQNPHRNHLHPQTPTMNKAVLLFCLR